MLRYQECDKENKNSPEIKRPLSPVSAQKALAAKHAKDQPFDKQSSKTRVDRFSRIIRDFIPDQERNHSPIVVKENQKTIPILSPRAIEKSKSAHTTPEPDSN